jgi:hypothetical protein
MLFSFRIFILIFILIPSVLFFENPLYAGDAMSQSVLDAIMDSTNEVTLWTSANGNLSTSDAIIQNQSAIQGWNNNEASRSFSAAPSQDGTSSSNGSSWPLTVFVTEKVPWATCWCNINGERQWSAWESCPGDISLSERKYECQVDKWMAAFQNIIRDITKWFVYITMLLGVLALAWAGILWAWGSESEEYTKKAKWWAFNIIIWLALLFTFRYILGFLAPWVFQ